ncbi:MAG TPA: KilA-N domain-containing protein [Desulfuromonadales bacterium]|nr:KilA-N domain-containing protein [Desulfuromonadales bacterium]
MAKIEVLKNEVRLVFIKNDDYICITDIARYKDAARTDYLISNWMRNRNTIEFLGIWEQINNPAFNPIEFDGIKKESGLNSFILTAKQWIERTRAIGIISKAGRYGGTYAHKDIAFEFASWISVEFKLYLIKEFQRLKEDEHKTLGWDIRRNLAKLNYRIHTDAIREHLIPPELTPAQMSLVYASEADLLNMALFGKTAAQWRSENPREKGNIRDQAESAQLLCLANMENLNAHFIAEGVEQPERLRRLNQLAIQQMRILTADDRRIRMESVSRGDAEGAEKSVVEG